jgi:hypothetical protein
MGIRLVRPLLAALAVATVAALAGGQLAGASRASFSLPDPAGDSGTALDITSVAIDHDPATGNLTVTVPLPASATLPSGHRVAVFFDTDENPKTGTHGADYAFSVDGPTSFRLLRWTGSAFERLASATASLSYDGGARIRLNKSDIGSPTGFNFFVETIEGSGQAGHADLAPDSGSWNIKLAVAKPVLKKLVMLSNGKPTAGKEFGLAFALLVDRAGKQSTILPSTLSCRASVGGLPATTRVKVTTINGVKYAACYTTPKAGTRGKTLSMKFTVTSTAFTPKLVLNKTYVAKIV